jgi:hypothetical protein
MESFMVNFVLNTLVFFFYKILNKSRDDLDRPDLVPISKKFHILDNECTIKVVFIVCYNLIMFQSVLPPPLSLESWDKLFVFVWVGNE